MKKIFVLAVIAIAFASCSKKENTDIESNVMLEEPTVKTVETATADSTTAETKTETQLVDSISTETK